MAVKQKTFDPKKRKHWPIIDAYKDGRVSLKQTEAQLRDLGMEEWELRLYLDDDQNTIDD